MPAIESPRAVNRVWGPFPYWIRLRCRLLYPGRGQGVYYTMHGQKRRKDMKRGLPLNQEKWLVEPGCVVLVTGGTMQKANVLSISWQTPVQTADPCLVLLVMHQARYTYELIRQNHELAINIPGADLLEQTHLVGSVSGRKIDKFREAGLTPVPARLVQPPLVAEC